MAEEFNMPERLTVCIMTCRENIRDFRHEFPRDVHLNLMPFFFPFSLHCELQEPYRERSPEQRKPSNIHSCIKLRLAVQNKCWAGWWRQQEGGEGVHGSVKLPDIHKPHGTMNLSCCCRFMTPPPTPPLSNFWTKGGLIVSNLSLDRVKLDGHGSKNESFVSRPKFVFIENIRMNSVKYL